MSSPVPTNANRLPLFHVVGFTGHRRVGDAAKVAAVIRSTLESFRAESPREWIGLSSVASGSDQLFVDQVLGLGLSWHAILPLPKAEFQKDFTPDEWVDVERMLTRAEHLRVISENGAREDAYLDCGMETVDGADVLLALWDGLAARGKGGTADVVEYARSLGKPVVIIDAATLEVRRERFEQLQLDDLVLTKLNQLPEAAAGWGANPFNAPAAIFAFQQKCDFAAINGAPHFRRLITGTVILHVLATLIAAAALAFDLHYVVLPWMKLLCLAGALGVAILLRQHHSLHQWVHCRLAAEFCRSALATWGLPRSTTLFGDQELPVMHGLTRTLHILHSRSATARPVPMEEFKQLYIEKRIDDQLAYYRRQEARAVPLFRRLKLGFLTATLLALGCTLAYAVSHTLHREEAAWVTTAVFYFLPISLPVVAASFVSLISINDLQRRVARYREMQLMLEDNRQRARFCQTWNSLERIVTKTERALRQEMLEWHSITTFTESH